MTVVPTLRVTSILAFGDSLTAGTMSTPVQTIVQLDPRNSYPAKLQALLNQRYSAQSIRVVNAGLPGEKAVEALSRFQSELARERPDVVIIMEGTNDLGPLTTTSGDAGASAIDTIVRDARARGVDPILATIPPQRANRATAPQVIPFNDRIRAIAAGQGVPLVDVYQVINSGLCNDSPAAVSLPGDVYSVHTTVPCIGDGNLHPTRQGYTLIANAMFNRIMALYESRGRGGSSVLPQTQMPGGEPPTILEPAWVVSGFR